MLINYLLLLFLQAIIGCSAKETVYTTRVHTIFTTYCPTATQQQHSYEPESDLAASSFDIQDSYTATALSTGYWPTSSSVPTYIHNEGDVIYNVSFNNADDGFYVNYFVNCSMDNKYPFYNFTKQVCGNVSNVGWNNTAKRQGEPELAGNTNSENSKSWAKKVQNEFKETLGDDIKRLLSDDKFVGGLSIYMSIYHAAFARDFTKVSIELIRFDRIFKYTWTTFWKANNYKKFHRFGWSHLGWACQAPNDGQDIQSVTRAIAYMYIVAMPIPHYVFSNVYLDALNYLKENQDSIYDYTCIKEEERKWMDSLIEDPGAVNFHVSYFLNLYKAYADLYGEPPNNDKRIVWGWGGARREINADEVDNSFKNLQESGTILGIGSLAGVSVWSLFGLITSDISLLASTSFDDLLEKVSKSNPKTNTQNTATTEFSSSTTSSSSSSLSSSTCTDYFLESDETYPNLANDGSLSKTEDDEDDEYLKNTKRDATVRDGRKIGQICGAKNSYSNYEECMRTLGTHMVWVNTENHKVYGKIDPTNLDDIKKESFREYTPDIHYESTDEKTLPVYIVNQQGRSPGVACNALKFIANNFNITKYFSGSASIKSSKDTDIKVSILAMSKGSYLDRSKATGKYSCKNTDDDEMANQYNTEGMKWQRDEFPPSFMNQIVTEAEHITVTCVPFYDNQLDGCQLTRFYKGKNLSEKPRAKKQCIKSHPREIKRGYFVNEKNNRVFPGMVTEGNCVGTDYTKYVPYGEKNRETQRIGKGQPVAILVNVMDHNNNPIDCTKYEEGSKYERYLG
ncbi:hypothetical protein MG7_05304 [Candida albicans P34048]|nr:hypothetical protein MG7_05304 [Candida albicans P34048]